jgi:hypothetical protein
LRQRLLFLTVAACVFAASPSAPAADRSLEYAVKATFLYKFAPFVDWPSYAFGDAEAPFVVCIVGTDPFGEATERTLEGQRIGTHPLVLRRLAAAEARSGCHVMFVVGSPAQAVAQALDAVRGTPTLTVTDAPGAPGIIRFVMIEGRVNFDIDASAAAANHLTISSKLLALAHTVSGGERR